MENALGHQDRGVVCRLLPNLRTASAWMLALFHTAVCTAVYSILDVEVRQKYRYPDSERLVRLSCAAPGQATVSGCSVSLAASIKEQVPAIDEVGYQGYGPAELETRQGKRTVAVRRVSSGFLSTLGVRPLLGRWFMWADDQANASDLAVISYRAWNEHFHRSPSVLGDHVMISGRRYGVVGVMGPDFSFPGPDVWAWVLEPVTVALVEQKGLHDADVVARLHNGVTDRQVREQLARAALRLAGEADGNVELESRQLRPALMVRVSSGLWLIGAFAHLALVSCSVLLVALYAGTTTRLMKWTMDGGVLREVAADRRWGLGACLYAVASAAVYGSVLSLLCWALGKSAAPEPSAGAGVIAAVAGMTVVAVVRLGERRATSRRVLAVIQTSQAVTCALAMCAAVWAAGKMVEARFPDLGFSARDLYAVEITANSEEAAAGTYVQNLLAHVRGSEGVHSAALASSRPLGDARYVSIRLPDSSRNSEQLVKIQTVSNQYFAVMRIPRVAGSDARGPASAVNRCEVVINRALASRLGEGKQVLGRQLLIPAPRGLGDVTCVVQGLVGDAQDVQVKRVAEPQVYVLTAKAETSQMNILVRAASLDYARRAATTWVEGHDQTGLQLGQVVSVDATLSRATSTDVRFWGCACVIAAGWLSAAGLCVRVCRTRRSGL